jgi:hypothetical protein
MIKTLKAIVVSAGLALLFAANTMNSISDTDTTSDTELSSQPLLLDDLYACQWWPICKDPEQKPVLVPNDASTPKPNGDTDAGKDKQDQAQLS